MSREEIRRALEQAQVPDAEAAEERGWRVVDAAFDAERRMRPLPRRRYLRPAVAIAVAAAVAAVAATPPGEAVGRWVADALDPGRSPARPALTSLPVRGRLLVDSFQGPWVVQRDGAKRRLGDYAESGWSPRGLFVVATDGRQIAALEPSGDVRWTLARAEPVTRPAWSPDGFRVAYMSGASLRAVAGDGTGDRRVAAADPRVGASWRPGGGHELAYVDPHGRVVVADADDGRAIGRSSARLAPRQLLWAANGERLIAIARDGVELLSPTARRLGSVPLPAGFEAGVGAVRPGGAELALVRTRPSANRAEVVTILLGGDGARPARRLFAGRGRFDGLAWSPDGRWLLVSWPDADQWVYIRSSSVSRVEAVSNIARQFDPGGGGRRPPPRVRGWCCPPR